MNKVDEKYEAELNFVDEFNLSRNGKIKEIITEFNIIRLCLQETNELDKQYHPMLDRILVMPLRKLLCEDSSVLLSLCPDFKMPPLIGFPAMVSENQTIIRPPFSVKPIDQWIQLNQWLEQKISWFDRDANSAANMIPNFSYECIMKKLNGRKYKAYKPKFESMFHKKQIEIRGEMNEVYCKRNPTDESANQEIYQILEMIGYNTLSLYDFLKHMSDKRGAHIDVGHSLVVEMVNSADSSGLTPVHYLAIQMVFAAKKQIQELENYWPEMPDLII
ncbi:hypothetical protein [Clostridium botulinum]|uniref:hypothetical protein n=1 Tax=Clostridium botulinum TaxID=1491 RepID=UPI001969CF6E|nr:hypothetical protein [Clostridium botulinum]